MAWPVDTPPKVLMPTTFKNAEGEVVRINKPSNVVAALHALQRGAVEVKTTQEAYDGLKDDTP